MASCLDDLQNQKLAEATEVRGFAGRHDSPQQTLIVLVQAYIELSHPGIWISRLPTRLSSSFGSSSFELYGRPIPWEGAIVA